VTTSTTLWPGRVRAAYAETIEGAVVDEGFGPIAVDVDASRWVDALLLARDGLGCAFFDFLTAVDELPDGFRIVCHVASHTRDGVQHLIVRTLVPDSVPSVAHVYAGARWHERETAEMFGIGFDGHPGIRHLYLPAEFEGHPLRKDFPLLSREIKPWPGLVDVEPMPGEEVVQEVIPE